MIQNYLTVDEQDSNRSSLWAAVTNCAVARSTEQYLNEPASIRVSPVSVGGSDMEVRLVRTVALTPNIEYRCSAFVYAESASTSVSISPELYDASGNVIAYAPTGTTITKFKKWVMVHTEFVTPANTVSGRLVISAEADGEIYFDQVGLIEWPDVLPNDFLKLVERHLPRYMVDADSDVEGVTGLEPDRPLHRFLDVNTINADAILQSTRAFDYIAEADGVVGYDRSTLVDPNYYPADYVAEASWLPWLAQLVGVIPLSSSSGGSLTPWFWFEREYPTWNAWQEDIDSAINPEFPVTAIDRDASGVVTATLGTQSAGDTFVPSEFYAIEIEGTTDFDGAFVIDTVSGSGPYTLTWYQSGSVTSEAPASATGTFTDASWSEVEDSNPQAFQTVDVLKHLTRTGATGINSGSVVSIVAAVRAVLEGVDMPATVSRSGNVVTVTTVAPHGLFATDYVAIYQASNRTLNSDDLTVATVVSPYQFTISQNGYDIADADCWITDKYVAATQGSTIWDLDIETIEAQTYAVDLLYQAVDRAKPAGLTVSYGYTTP